MWRRVQTKAKNATLADNQQQHSDLSDGDENEKSKILFLMLSTAVTINHNKVVR